MALNEVIQIDDDGGGVAFDQTAETVPIVKDADGGIWPRASQLTDDGRKQAARADRHRRDLETIGLPIIGRDAMLFWTGSHQHGRPVRTRDSRNDRPRVQCEGADLHQFLQGARVNAPNALGAEAVDAHQHDMFGRGRPRRRRHLPCGQYGNGSNDRKD